MANKVRKSAERRKSDDNLEEADGRIAKRTRSSKAKENIDDPMVTRRRRATSSESVSFQVASPSPEPPANGATSSSRVETAPNPASDNADSNQHPSSINAGMSQQDAAGAISPPPHPSASPMDMTHSQGPATGRAGSQGSDNMLFIPTIETSASAEPDANEPYKLERVTASNWSKFKELSQELVAHDRMTTKILQKMNSEHQNALERARKVAGRRNNRIEQLERDNAALRSNLSSKAAGTSSSEEWVEKYDMSQQALQMLTDDCTTWEGKYGGLQLELDAAVVKTSAAEREARHCREQADKLSRELDKCKDEIKDDRKRLKSGTAQLEGLQAILGRVDNVVVDRVRELASVSSSGSGEGQRSRVADIVAKLVDEWTDFQAEYDEAIGGGE